MTTMLGLKCTFNCFAKLRSAREIAILILLSFTVLVGCATKIPLESLKSFNSSFIEVQKAGDLLYDETAKVIASRNTDAKANCGSDAAGAPACFDPRLVGNTGVRNEDASVTIRRLSLQLLSEYSLVLVELSEGKSVEELKSSINGMASVSADIVAIAGVSTGALPALFKGSVVSALTDLATELERVRSTEAVRRSLIDERETVAATIDALIADTAKMYEIFYLSQKRTALKSPGTTIAEVRQTVVAYHNSLSAYVSLLRQAKASHERLVAIAGRVSTKPNDVQAVAEEALKIRVKADAFWDAVRQIRK